MPVTDLFAASRRVLRRLLGCSRHVALAAALVPLGAVGMPAGKAAPTVSLPPEFPAVPFSLRITDLERVPADAEGDAFRVEFEVLNWTFWNGDGLVMSTNVGVTALEGTAPAISGASIDPDGRGGALGGNDIGPGIFDATAIHSGRGRGDIPFRQNDWHVKSQTPSFVRFDRFDGSPVHPTITGSAIPQGRLVFPFAVPGFGTDGLGDSALDGGPGPYVPASPGHGPIGGGNGNILDGFVLDVDDWDAGEVFSMNWFLATLTGASGGLESDAFAAIATASGGSQFAFGALNLARVEPSMGSPAGSLPGAVFDGNTGFDQSGFSFYDTVYEIPNPAEFAAEFGAGLTAPFLNPGDNIFNAPINTQLIVPEPGTLGLVFSGFAGLAAVGGRGRRGRSAT